MKRDHSDYARLVTELEADAAHLDTVVAANRRAQDRIAAGARDELDYAALGYTIHNVYGVVETYCMRVAKFHENGISGESWHADLMRRMALEIPNIRPALLDQDLWYALDDLRAFRHKFRHLYARPLDPKRIAAVQETIEPTVDAFRRAHRRFVAVMAQMRDSLLDDI